MPTGVRWTGAVGEAVIGMFSPGGNQPIQIVVEPRLVNRELGYESVVDMTTPPRPTAPQIDVYIRNKGDHAVQLRKAKIEVLDSGRLESCIPPQGGGPEPPPFELSYFINLPIFPLQGEQTVYRTLNQQVASGGAGSVNLYLRTLEQETQEGLFALRVTLITEEPTESINVGRFIVGLPGSVHRYGDILPEDRQAIQNLQNFEEHLESTWCYRSNLATVNRFIALPGMRSPAMKALNSIRLAPNWPSFADPRQPREAAEALLKLHAFVDAPMLAIFAAERTGDTQFEAEIKRRAVAMSLRYAEEELGFAPRKAILDTCAALAISDSTAGREILARAEASLRHLGDAN
jgi:hypothetical protein